jgi:hypothetical protein
VADSDAFISYSHKADGDLAPALEAGLQRLAKPWNQRRAMEVFLDQQDLSASPHLWSSIVVALDGSDWFLLLASPQSAGSYWVGREITHWLSVPERRERMLLVLTAGTMQWADGDFTADSDAVNPALRGAFEDEPLYVDMTQVDRSITLDLRNPLFKERVATLAATIRHTTVGDLIGEDTRQFQRARRLRRIAVGALAVLTVGALIASVVALQQRSEAQSQRNEAVRQKAEADAQRVAAEKNAAEARARELAATALDTMNEDPALAALVAVEANYPDGAVDPIDVPEARTTLGVTLRTLQGTAALRVGPRIIAPTTAILRADSSYLATANETRGTRDADGNLIPPAWWDTTTGESVASPVSDEEQERMMTPLGDVRIEGGAASFVPPTAGVTPVTEPWDFSDDASTVVGTDAATGDLVVESLVDGSVVARLAVPTDTSLFEVQMLSPERVVASTDGAEIVVWDLTAGGTARTVDTGVQVNSIAALDDHRILVNGSPFFVDANGDPTTEGSPPSVYTVDVILGGSSSSGPTIADASLGSAGAMTPSPDGALVAAITVGDDGLSQPVAVWDLGSGVRLATIDTADANDIHWIDATTLAIASARGVEQYRVRPSEEVAAGEFAALDVVGAQVAMRRYGAETVDVADGPLRNAGLTMSGTGAGPVGSPAPGTVALAPDGSAIATLAHDTAEVGFTSFPTGVVVKARDGGRVLASLDGGRSMAFDPTGSLLAVGVVDSILLVDCSTWKVSRTIPVEGYTPTQLLWVHEGRQLISNGAEQAVNGDRHFDIVDVDAGAVEAQGPSDVSGVAVSPNGAVLALGLEGGEVRLMGFDADGTFAETPLATMIADPFRVTGLSFSPDGERLVTSGMRSTIVWDVRSPRAPRQVQVVSDLPAWAFGDFAPSDVIGVPTTARGTWGLVAFRPDGASFILAGGSGAVEMPDFDPAFACRQATAADRARLEALLGAPSACLRVPGLMDAPAP